MVKPKLVKVHAPKFSNMIDEGAKFVNSPQLQNFKKDLESFAGDLCNNFAQNDENVIDMLTQVASKDNLADSDEWWEAYDESEDQFIQGCTTELLKKLIK